MVVVMLYRLVSIYPLFICFYTILNDGQPPQFNHLPLNLALQHAALPPLQPIRGRGRGRGRGYIPPFPAVCFSFLSF
jgi:hypothetical protein